MVLVVVERRWIDAMSMKELKALIRSVGLGFADCVEKSDMRARAREAQARQAAAALSGSSSSPRSYSGSGSGLAPKDDVLGGVVLHSPIASGLRTITPNGPCSPVCCCRCFEPFDNLGAVAKVRCPVFVLHGTQDREVPHWHGEMLARRRAATRSLRALGLRDRDMAFWAEGAGHGDLVERHTAAYYRHLRTFLAQLLNG